MAKKGKAQDIAQTAQTAQEMQDNPQANETKETTMNQDTEGVTLPTTKRAAPEVVAVTMEDGRVVEFTGKRAMLKEVIVGEGTAAVRFDFRNGQTITAQVPAQHLLYSAGHGYAQKLGDEVAGAKNDDGTPMNDEDRFLAVEALHQRLQGSDDWNKGGEGGGSVSGAGIVLKAVMEVSGKDLAGAKAFVDAILADAEAKGQKLSRQALYASFRVATSRTGKVIARLEAEKGASKAPAIDSDSLFAEASEAA
jgi:hypothetical protein